jgi:hypothetical protein
MAVIQNLFKNKEYRLMDPSQSMSHSSHEEAHINKLHLPQIDVKYLGVHLDRRFT